MLPGEVLDGKYRVDQVLGVGGMGVVVAATHLQLGQKVALKFMLPQGLRHSGLVERFAREARAAARLKSDHVARVLDVGTLGSGSPYMVMEFLEGYDLAALVETHGPMSVDTAVDCVLQACDAVAEAHALGIVHRDLKPRNLFLTRRNDGRALIKVLDFGISKDRKGADLGLTGTSEIIGSPNYMSPEQLKSTRLADERSDIWALGVILYELLTGRVPFVADSITQLTAMVLTEPPRPITELRPDTPRDLARIVERCLDKEPDRRFASVADLAASLEKFAPHDTKELASRIARIASGPRVSAVASPSARLPVTGSTSVSWSEKTERAASKRKTFALVVGLVALVGVASVLGAIAVTRAGRNAVASAPAVATTATAAAAVSISASPATAFPVATLAPAASSTALPTAKASSTAAASAAAASAAAASTAAASASPAKPAPTANGASPAGAPPKKAEPAASGSSDTPKYRTSW
jgi:serine/threonine-protein kinase